MRNSRTFFANTPIPHYATILNPKICDKSKLNSVNHQSSHIVLL
jgi:hypothetical protein